MVAHPDELVVEILDREFLGLRRVDAAGLSYLRISAVTLPFPLAAPAHDGEQSETVAEVVDRAVLAPDVLEAHGVQVHVFNQLKLLESPLAGILHEDVVRPAGGFDEHRLAVQLEQAMAVFIQVALDVAKSETDLLAVGNLVAFRERDIEVVEFGLSQVAAPPDAGLDHGFVDGKGFSFARGERDCGLELAAFVDSAKGAFDGGGAVVHEGHFRSEGSFLEVFDIHFRLDEDVCDPDVRRADKLHLAPDSHAFVHGTRVPVHIAVVQALLGSLEHAHLEDVAGFRNLGDVVFADAEHTDGGVRRGDLLAVHPDVCGVSYAFEAKDVVEALLGFESGGVYPRRIENALVNRKISVLLEDVLAEDSGFVQRTCDCARDDCVVDVPVAFALKLPMAEICSLQVAAGGKGH